MSAFEGKAEMAIAPRKVCLSRPKWLRCGRLLCRAALYEVDRQHGDRAAETNPVEQVGARESVLRDQDRQCRGAEGNAQRYRQRTKGEADDAGGAYENTEDVAGEIPCDRRPSSIHQHARLMPSCTAHVHFRG